MLIDYQQVEINQQEHFVLSEVNFQVNEGEFVYIIGKVGTGKTSLLKTIYGELSIAAGNARVLECDMNSLKRKHIPRLRRQLGIVFQDFQLLTDRTVYDNLAFVLKATGWKDRHEMDTRIEEVLSRVGMSNKGYKLPHELSGGEQQRIVLARAILNRPKIILADEPTGALDSKNSKTLMETFTMMNKSLGSTILMVTHSVKAASHASRVLFIKDGEVYHQIYRGSSSENEFYQKISDTLTILATGGDLR